MTRAKLLLKLNKIKETWDILNKIKKDTSLPQFELNFLLAKASFVSGN